MTPTLLQEKTNLNPLNGNPNLSHLTEGEGEEEGHGVRHKSEHRGREERILSSQDVACTPEHNQYAEHGES